MVVPAVADNSVLVGLFTSEIVGLRRAGYSGESGVDACCLAVREKFGDRRGVLANVAFAQPHHIENGSTFHGGQGLSSDRNDRLVAAGLAVAQFGDRIDVDQGVHLVLAVSLEVRLHLIKQGGLRVEQYLIHHRQCLVPS